MAADTRDKTPFVVRKNLTRTYIFVVIGAIVALASLYVLVSNLGTYDQAPWLIWGSGVFLVAGTACSLLFLHFMPDQKIALQIDEHGITDNTFALAAGLIPWDAIKAVYDYRVRAAKFLVVELRDPAGFAKTIRHEAAIFIEGRLDQGLPCVEIRPNALPGNYQVSELLNEVSRFRPKLVKAPRVYRKPKAHKAQVRANSAT